MERTIPMTDLRDRLRSLGLICTSTTLDDVVPLATKKRWSATEIFEHVCDIEEKDRVRRGLEHDRAKHRASRSARWTLRPLSLGVEALARPRRARISARARATPSLFR